MIRLLALLCGLALPVAAQDPLLRAEIDETAAIPGQAVSLRLTVLVPTFMPAPPVWPSYEAPNLLVRVAFTGPVSERIDGVTWSGVSRRYLIAPMVPGEVTLPAQEIDVSWADPETNAPRRTTLTTDAITITGLVPAGAEGLDPFLAADSLTLEQSVEGTAEGMVPGDSLTRTVTATIEGTSPMFLPPLLPPHDIAGVRAYPASPLFEEARDRDVVRGTRSEHVTLLAEGGGQGEASAVTLDWYNLRTGTVETATLAAFAVSVDGPPPGSAAPAPLDWRAIGFATLTGLILLTLLAAALRRLAPPAMAWLHSAHADWLASETRAWHGLQRAVARRDHAALWPALDGWNACVHGPDPRQDARLSAALTALRAARFGRSKGDSAASWRELARTLTKLRQGTPRKAKTAALPPLNP